MVPEVAVHQRKKSSKQRTTRVQNMNVCLLFGAGPEEFSDWSENDVDADLLNQPNEEKFSKSVSGKALCAPS